MEWPILWFQWAGLESVITEKPLLPLQEDVDHCLIDSLLQCLTQSWTYKEHPVIVVRGMVIPDTGQW